MSSKLVPSDPSSVMVIRRVTENITTFSTPFKRFGLIKVGGRGTVVRLSSGALAVFSPTALTPDVQKTLSTLGGPVKYILAGDLEHHIFLGPWHQAFPTAQTIVPEGLPEKRAKSKVEAVRFDHVITASQKDNISIDSEFDSEFDVQYVPGHANKELVVYYRREKTLIEADLLFNAPATEQYSKSPEDATSGLLTRFFSYINSTQGSGLAQRRVIWYGISAMDRKGFAKSVERINRWDFERIVPCHGDVIEGQGKNVFGKIMRWHLELARKQ